MSANRLGWRFLLVANHNKQGQKIRPDFLPFVLV